MNLNQIRAAVFAVTVAAARVCLAGDFSIDPSHPPLYLAAPSPLDSVYLPPSPAQEGSGINEGAVHVDLSIRYLTDYVFRGLDRSDGTGLTATNADRNSSVAAAADDIAKKFGHEDAPNLQVDGKLSFDLGKLPHPYVGTFVNVYNSDPVSRFQEVRPFFGAEWTIRPFILEGGYQSFIFPERETLNTAEVYGRITFDDSLYFRSERPIFSPYIYAAYDFDLYNGWYFEAGVKHDFVLEDSGITISAIGDVAYTMGNQEFRPAGASSDTGLQHYDIGVVGQLSLNQFFGFSRRYGEFNFEGYLFYTDGIANHLRADTQVWGGVGIRLKY